MPDYDSPSTSHQELPPSGSTAPFAKEFCNLATAVLGRETKPGGEIKTDEDLTKQNSLEYEQMYAAIESAKAKGPIEYRTSIGDCDSKIYNYKITADQETNSYRDEKGQECAIFSVTTTLERINGLSLPNFQKNGGVVPSEIEVGPIDNKIKLCHSPID